MRYGLVHMACTCTMALQKEDPRPLLGVHALFGDLVQHLAFVASLDEALRAVYGRHTRDTDTLPGVAFARIGA